MSADELMAGVTSDLGGVDELSVLERSYIRRLGDVDIACRLALSDLAQHGLGTARGVRAYDRLLTGIGSFDRLAQRLGIKRRPKAVQTLEQIMRGGE